MDILPIGMVARKLGVCVKTLRLWDRDGKFRPEYRAGSGRRGYTPRQVSEILEKWRAEARRATS